MKWVTLASDVADATASPPSVTNLDINGSGGIDPDEAWVRGAATSLGLLVPAETPGEGVVLSDTLDDITTTGTVSFSSRFVASSGS